MSTCCDPVTYCDSNHILALDDIIIISINLLVVYRESVNLIGYITRRLSADSLQLRIANENRLF